MSEIPVPAPSGSGPEGAPAWLSVDADAWAHARPAPWTWPLWSVLALVATVAWAIAVEPVPVCSDAAPCGPDWVGMVQNGLAAGLLYWLARLPELTVLAAPALAAVVAWVELPGAEPASRIANIAVIAALAFGWAAARARLGSRTRQRRLAERAAGVRHPLPGLVGPLWRGTIPLAAGLLLCAVAAGAVALGLSGIRADERHAAGAVRTPAQVIGRGEESLRVRTDDARRLTVDAAFPEDYGIGGAVTVLEDGPWRRLAAEPYDAFGWQLLTLAVGLPGLSLLTVGVLARRREDPLSWPLPRVPRTGASTSPRTPTRDGIPDFCRRGIPTAAPHTAAPAQRCRPPAICSADLVPGRPRGPGSAGRALVAHPVHHGRRRSSTRRATVRPN